MFVCPTLSDLRFYACCHILFIIHTFTEKFLNMFFFFLVYSFGMGRSYKNVTEINIIGFGDTSKTGKND